MDIRPQPSQAAEKAEPRRPIAYFITWTAYGTRLHGHPTGSVDADHNTFATPYSPRDDLRRDAARARMTSQPFVLSPQAQRIVAQTIIDHASIRGWTVLAHDALSTHVHVVVNASDHSPEEMMRQFKSWSTRRLRDAGNADAIARLWTRHGSTRYLWNTRAVEGATRYVSERQRLPVL